MVVSFFLCIFAENSVSMNENPNIPLLDCPGDFLLGDASGKIMNEYGRYPCKIQCGVYAFLVRGSARATIDITQYEFHENDLLVLNSGSFLLIHEFSDDALVYYILFSSSFLERNTLSQSLSLTSLQLMDPILHLNHEQTEVFVDLYQLLSKACNTSPAMLDADMMAHIYAILQHNYRTMAQNGENLVSRPQDRRTEIYRDYCQLVLKHYAKWHHVSQYAEAMQLTLPHLSATVKSVCHRTAGDIIIEAILTDAKAQLKLTNLQVKEIAISLGFENVAFFNRFFKTHAGVTPKTYRSGN